LLKVLNSWKDPADDKRHEVLTTEVHSQILVVKIKICGGKYCVVRLSGRPGA